jgi:hypothetical protein
MSVLLDFADPPKTQKTVPTALSEEKFVWVVSPIFYVPYPAQTQEAGRLFKQKKEIEMRVRTLLTAIGVFVGAFTSLGFSNPAEASNPTVFVRGLAMLQLQDADSLRITLPDAPGHKATITFVGHDGSKRILAFSGRGAIDVADARSTTPTVNVPELVRMKELYGEAVKPILKAASKTISIPWSGIGVISTEKVSDVRYTFVRKDNGEEVETFRPRKIAETIRIQLNSGGTMRFDQGKTNVDLQKISQIWIEYLPQNMNSGGYEEHFHHYLHHVVRPAGKDFEVEPRKLSPVSRVTPRIGNSLWMYGDVVFCYLVRLD